LERAQLQAKVRTAQAEADRAARRGAVARATDRVAQAEEELGRCVVHSPRDGLVVHHVPDAGQWGAGGLAAGDVVHEGQKLLSLPDLSRLAVLVRVPEAAVVRVRPGQAARVLVDAFPDRRLEAKVEAVASRPSRPNWMKPDEKTYDVRLTLGGATEGLKPGMTAGATIATGVAGDEVLTVPRQALLPSPQAGRRTCVVRTPRGLEQRQVVVGESDGKSVEVRSGLREGEEVVLDPRAVLTAEPARPKR
jgi:RND family efflux transporter MFP subunit